MVVTGALASAQTRTWASIQDGQNIYGLGECNGNGCLVRYNMVTQRFQIDDPLPVNKFKRSYYYPMTVWNNTLIYPIKTGDGGSNLIYVDTETWAQTASRRFGYESMYINQLYNYLYIFHVGM
jgi:hypothetical protein